jgi:hypothetical protein
MDRQTAPVQVAALIGALLLVLASALIVQRAATPMLRLLEGYWPKWAARPRLALQKRIRKRADVDKEAFLELHRQQEKVQGELTVAQAGQRTDLESELADLSAKLGKIESRAHRRPPGTEVMPTRTGNILRAAEVRPMGKYGLDAVIVWPHLWLVMPDGTRQELAAVRTALDDAAAAVIWGLAFCLFTPLAWWALPTGLVVAMAAAVWWVPDRAETFADLIDAVYDLHRIALYEQLRWPLPDTPEQERTAGDQITQYLWRGTSPPDGFHFTSP